LGSRDPGCRRVRPSRAAGVPVDNAPQPERLLKNWIAGARAGPRRQDPGARATSVRSAFKRARRSAIPRRSSGRRGSTGSPASGAAGPRLDACEADDEDPRYQRSRRNAPTLSSRCARSPGPRAGEIERRQADYEKERRESPARKHAGPSPETRRASSGNWLRPGVFPNDKTRGSTHRLPQARGGPPIPRPFLPVGKSEVGRARPAPEGEDRTSCRVAHLGSEKPEG